MPLLSQADSSNGLVLKNGAWQQLLPKNRSDKLMEINKSALGFGTYTMGLLEYINSVILGGFDTGSSATPAQSIDWDRGWCGAGSASVNLRTYAAEMGRTDPKVDPYLANPDASQFIYQTMQLIGTNVTSGGTKSAGMLAGFNSLTGHGSFGTLVSIPDFVQSQPLQSITTCPPGIVSGSSCHFLSLNGVEGHFYKVFDPWGSIYDVSFAGGNLSFEKGNRWGDLPTHGGVAQVGVVVQITDYIDDSLDWVSMYEF